MQIYGCFFLLELYCKKLTMILQKYFQCEGSCHQTSKSGKSLLFFILSSMWLQYLQEHFASWTTTDLHAIQPHPLLGVIGNIVLVPIRNYSSTFMSRQNDATLSKKFSQLTTRSNVDKVAIHSFNHHNFFMGQCWTKNFLLQYSDHGIALSIQGFLLRVQMK